jgi:hypothetical protein
MEIRIDLTPQMEAGLSAQAQMQGMSVNAYVQSMIERIAAQRSATDLSLEDFEAGLDELAAASDNLPVLPAEAYTRESINGDG